jgi:hypothetical protein
MSKKNKKEITRVQKQYLEPTRLPEHEIRNLPVDPRHEAAKKAQGITEALTRSGNEYPILQLKSIDDAGRMMIDPNLTYEQKMGQLSNFLFAAGNESVSFMMDLWQSKGMMVKETRTFKGQIRFDLDYAFGIVSTLFQDMAKGILNDIQKGKKSQEILLAFAERLGEGGDKLKERMAAIVKQRSAEKGWGIYLGNDGKPYSILDADITERMKKDRDELITRRKKFEDEQSI